MSSGWKVVVYDNGASRLAVLEVNKILLQGDKGQIVTPDPNRPVVLEDVEGSVLWAGEIWFVELHDPTGRVRADWAENVGAKVVMGDTLSAPVIAVKASWVHNLAAITAVVRGAVVAGAGAGVSVTSATTYMPYTPTAALEPSAPSGNVHGCECGTWKSGGRCQEYCKLYGKDLF